MAEQSAPTASPVVRYAGMSDSHKITAAQWKKAGVEGQNIVRWNSENYFEVPVSDLNEAALEVLRREKDFVVP